jgi:hypothetical protein
MMQVNLSVCGVLGSGEATPGKEEAQSTQASVSQPPHPPPMIVTVFLRTEKSPKYRDATEQTQL